MNSVNLLVFSLSIPIAGYLSDKLGRKPVILTTAVLFIVLSYPLYMLLSNPHVLIQALSLVSFAMLAAGIVGVVPATLSEMFSTPIRYSGIVLSYNIGFSFLAGLTPVIATYLLYTFKFPEAPSFNLILAGIIAMLGSFAIKKQSHQLSLNNPLL